MSTLLQQSAESAAKQSEEERGRLLAALRAVLAELLPGETVWVYGSAARPGRFNQHSDIDLALERRPPRFSEYWLQGELEHRLHRRVDVVLLDDTRLRDKITREGLRWML